MISFTPAESSSPAVTILPSGCTATAAAAPHPPSATAANPAEPQRASIVPWLRAATRACGGWAVAVGLGRNGGEGVGESTILPSAGWIGIALTPYQSGRAEIPPLPKV